MAVKKPDIVIAGCGPGAPEYLTRLVIEAVENADVLVGSDAMQRLFPNSKAERIVVGADIAGILNAIELHPHHCVVVAVSGDPGISSLARPVIERFGQDACRILPGISSVQVAFARAGLDWMDARIISAHGRTPDVDVTSLHDCDKIAVLGGGAGAQEWVATLLERLGDNRVVVACEDLTLDTERVRTIEATSLRSTECRSRTLFLLLRKGILK